MTGISSVGSSSVYAYNPLDKNGDGVVGPEELEQAAKSGILSNPSFFASDDGEQSAADKFSINLSTMLLQLQQHESAQGADDSSGSSSESVFSSLDSDGDGKVTLDEFVAGRPKDMSEDDATALFKSLDTEESGYLTKDSFAEGLDALGESNSSVADILGNADDKKSSGEETTFADEMAAAIQMYLNTYGQYDVDQTNTTSA
jgi:Ca2+-binding EF-hand superfamily protein